MPKINRVRIANYKSIEALDFEARRVTVFIGGPNTGKSNILESLALMSPGLLKEFRRIFRLGHLGELFFDQDRNRTASVSTDWGRSWKLRYEQSSGNYGWTLNLEGGRWPEQLTDEKQFEANARTDNMSPFRYYSFRGDAFATGMTSEFGFLNPPFGSNLPVILATDRSMRESIAALFKAHQLRLEVRMHSSEILVSKIVDDVLFSYPFQAVSETLRRITFLKAALETNTDAVLILDEPETNTFPSTPSIWRSGSRWTRRTSSS